MLQPIYKNCCVKLLRYVDILIKKAPSCILFYHQTHGPCAKTATHEPIQYRCPCPTLQFIMRGLFSSGASACRASRSYRIDHWSLKFECGNSSGARAAFGHRARPAHTRGRSLLSSRVSFIAVLLFLVDDHAIVCCRLARTRHTLRHVLSWGLRWVLCLVLAGACRTRCRASMFWEVHPPDVPTVHLRPTSLRKNQTRALCWRKSTSAGRAEWLIQLWSRTVLPTRLGNNSSL